MYYCRNTAATTKGWVIWYSSYYIHCIRWSSDELANEAGLEKQPANLQHVIWQLLILVNALCIASAEGGDYYFFFLLFQKKAHEVLEGLHRMDVITDVIPKYKFTSQQYNKKFIAPPNKHCICNIQLNLHS